MSIYTTIDCDNCGKEAAYYGSPGVCAVRRAIRANGWVISKPSTRNEQHFCSKECYKKHKAKERKNAE